LTGFFSVHVESLKRKSKIESHVVRRTASYNYGFLTAAIASL
jgi:hypothetical protein